MLFDTKNTHPLLGVCARRSNNFKRPISCFLTAGNVRINLYAHAIPGQRMKFITVSVTRLGGHGLHADMKETFYLYPDGTCTLEVWAQVISATGGAIHTLQIKETYSVDQVLARGCHENWKWLCNQLDVLAIWLDDEKTARVNPYNPDETLVGEEEEIDRYITASLASMREFTRKLDERPLAPGIYPPPEEEV